MSYSVKEFGSNEEKVVLSNSYLQIEVSTLGATLVSLRLLRTQDHRDIVCGMKDAEGYLAHDKYFGACVGRIAGRIDQGRFTLNEKEYQLPQNNNGNSLHGGIHGFDRKHFTYEVMQEGEVGSIILQYTSVDGEEGYPGTVDLTVTYCLDHNRMSIDYSAASDQDTIINMTNHSYFNLEGHTSSTILDHSLRVDSNELLMIDEDSCPRGNRLQVESTPFDFRCEKKIRECIEQDHEQLRLGNGIDHFFIFTTKQDQITLRSPDSKVALHVSTDQVGANIYSANYLDGSDIGKENIAYPQRCAICLETQNYSNDINIHEDPTCILRKGDTYSSHTTYTFEVEE
ncbi:MAG: galactose mutarotase [Erysipelotrichales bacterium]|nr:galactose mutarotase [Erysipelotrichales bacterium]